MIQRPQNSTLRPTTNNIEARKDKIETRPISAMRHRTTSLIACCVMALTALALFGIWRSNHVPAAPPPDATATSEMDVVRHLHHLLVAKPRQREFVVSWEQGGYPLKVTYNRTTGTLIYIRPKPRTGWTVVPGFPFVARIKTVINSGCVRQPTCHTVSESLLRHASDNETLGNLLDRAGCGSQTDCMIK